MRSLALCALLACVPLFGGLTGVAAVDIPASARPAPVVDDDRAQCPAAGFTSIQAAVEAASSGTVVRVCPGRYKESVTVGKSLALLGAPGVYDAVDCFAPSLQPPSPLEYPIVGPDDDPLNRVSTAFTLAADDIDISGFVAIGLRRGVRTDDAYSGYRIHHSLFASNVLGVHLGSGVAEGAHTASRVDHNCLRGNDWGFSNNDGETTSVLVNARVDHNASFGNRQRAYEGLDIRDVRFDFNDSRQEPNTIILSGTSATRFVDNRIDRVGLGMNIGTLAPNRGLMISRNTFVHVRQPSTAIGFNMTPTGPSTEVTVSENTISGYTTGIAIGGPPFITGYSLENSEISGNVITNSVQQAVRLRPLNNHILFAYNTLNANTQRGIHAQCGPLTTTPRLCPTDNTFIGNEMLGNGLWDAQDESGIPGPVLNAWVANACVKDDPDGLCAPS